MNSIGNIFRLTTFGESHGAAIGGIIDGCPSNIKLSFEDIQAALDRRRPGQSKLTTSRNEGDKVEFLSGILDGVTTGASIGFIVKNESQISNDYNHLKEVFRPSHGDFTYHSKYGTRHIEGGGRTSARVTIPHVVAGAIANQALKQLGIEIIGYVSQIGDIKLESGYSALDLSLVDSTPVRCPDLAVAQRMIEVIESVKREHDSIGGIVSCVVKNCPVGLGEPIFGKLQASLANAMLSINAAKGFDYGSGFEGVDKKGSELNDPFTMKGNQVGTTTNNSGGIQGGISNGEDIYFRVAFKATPTIGKEQETVNIKGEDIKLAAKGRHDPCVLPRAVPIVEAMAAITIFDHYLIDKAKK